MAIELVPLKTSAAHNAEITTYVNPDQVTHIQRMENGRGTLGTQIYLRDRSAVWVAHAVADVARWLSDSTRAE